ncbi:MAG: 50S ribosomal protein L23 [Dehalococcoidia bacterium]|jgi:large subunit ribosomal protein L23|uniref:50S ribosomal protein L23 n=1 Tax=Candidatus Amarobacter glycogenicus TaxID=3140699 RepID=UPI001D5E4462|nr:50S ribosomal protein L23 [Dehalococcoidia bacterium]MBK6563463.1 50S ribosomal protein L23 [Dehalococcoidia bacterium]MBK7127548.1 50S ribosomal protein L23 [Dehalococcoidia bacterium]MBK7330260.1 50S ribosomal protein L23 [Dehalococcoidia bacterium]MBK7724825.1 50S ribosomal protein L23 [Dehalococcoidia bacterium]
MPKEIHPYAVLLRPIITEKTTVLTGADKYVFEVDLRANKNQIKEAVQVAFNVRVAEVNTMVMKGKPKRFGRRVTNRPDWKKAIVTLVSGDKIELFEGI